MANQNCEKILNLIPLYIDNQLNGEDTDIVSRHIASCKSCKKEYDFLSSLMKTTAGLEEYDLSSHFHKNIMKKATELKDKKRSQRIALLRRSSAGVAAAAVVALCIASYSNVGNRQTTNIPTESGVVMSAPIPEKTEESTDTPQAQPVKETPSPQKTVPKQNKPQEQAEVKNAVPLPDSYRESTAKDTGALVSVCEETVDNSAQVMTISEDIPLFTIAKITPNDENREAITEILSSYEKDDFGYIVPDIDTALQKITETGAEISTETTDTVAQNYIVIN